MNKKTIYSAALLCLLCLVSLVFSQNSVAAGITPIGPKDFSTLLTGIATAVAGLIGALATIMIIVAGFFYLTSAGSPERTGLAKKTLIYAVAGIAIALAADAIIQIVVSVVGK